MTKAKAKNNTQQALHSKPKEKSATQKALDETPIQVYSIDQQKIGSTFSEKTSEPLDLFKNINSDRPEIIALCNFLPCYTNDGRLNELGEFFQIKQDALLITCVDTINNIVETISTEEDDNTTNYINNTRAELLDFCTKIEDDITQLVSSFEDVKKSLNIKRDISTELADIKTLPDNFKVFDKFETITNCSPDVVKNWTNTKLWLQLCKEYKETLRSGVCKDDGLFVMKKSSPSNNSIVDPLLIFNPKNYDQKFDFNSRQPEINLDVFTENIQWNLDIYELFYKTFRNILTNDENSILNVPLNNLIRNSDKKEKGKTIARLSYLISREFRYSDRLRLLSELQSPSHFLLENISYPRETLTPTTTVDNRVFWDYFIGRFGDDITQTPDQSRLINSDNLTSLAQFKAEVTSITEPVKSLEVLSFENRYINDDVGKKRSAILTPGTAFLVDDVFTTGNTSLFNTINVTRFKNKISTVIKNIKEISGLNFGVRSWLFDGTSPRSNLQLVTGINNSTVSETAAEEDDQTAENKPDQDLLDEEIRNPFLLLRRLEQDLLINEGFISRFDLPKNVADGTSQDLGRALIDLALKDYENTNTHLLTCIFLYVIFKVDSNLKAKLGTEFFSTARSYIVGNKFRTYFDDYFLDNNNFITPNSKRVNVMNFDNYKTLDNIADLMTNLVHKFMAQDFKNNISDQFAFRNPFTANVGKPKTYYSRISLESMMLLMFYLCCLLLNETNQETIVGWKENQLTIKKSDNSAIIDNVYVNEQDVLASVTPELIPIFRKNEDILIYNYYRYDEIILTAENFINNEIISTRKTTSYFLSYLSTLENKFTNFINNFELTGTAANNAVSIRTNIQSILELSTTLNSDQIEKITLQVFSIEQLRLIKSKLSYMKFRFQENYDSLIKSLVVPYFVSLKDEDVKVIDGCLPIEDTHLVSWKLFLKYYLNRYEFRNPIANNAKIVSVGIPHKLYRKLQKPVEASTLQNTINDVNLVSINVYLVDNLRPLLVYKPQKFIFDINRFFLRTLNSYEDYFAELPPQFDNSSIVFPFLNLNDFQSKFSQTVSAKKQDYENLAKSLYELKYKNFISNTEYNRMIKNHTDSFMMEEYLNFITGQSFDENAFYNYDQTLTQFDSSFINIDLPLTEGSTQYLKNTGFVGTNAIKNSLICPKKFDRVFHLFLDPENFVVDQGKTGLFKPDDRTSGVSVIEYYFNKRDIVRLQSGEYRRRGANLAGQTDDKKQEFDSYFVELEIIA